MYELIGFVEITSPFYFESSADFFRYLFILIILTTLKILIFKKEIL